MSVHWTPVCQDQACDSVEYEFRQTYAVVLDPIRTHRDKGTSF